LASAKTGITEWFQLFDLNKPALIALADEHGIDSKGLTKNPLIKALVTAMFPGSNADVKSTTSSIASDEFVDSADHSLEKFVDQATTPVTKPHTGIEPETLGNYFAALSTDLQSDLPADMPWQMRLELHKAKLEHE
jgi:hypothetical protein